MGLRKSPGDDSREKEGGTRVVDPTQLSVELLPQIKGFPTILDNTILNTKPNQGKYNTLPRRDRKREAE